MKRDPARRGDARRPATGADEVPPMSREALAALAHALTRLLEEAEDRRDRLAHLRRVDR